MAAIYEQQSVDSSREGVLSLEEHDAKFLVTVRNEHAAVTVELSRDQLQEQYDAIGERLKQP